MLTKELEEKIEKSLQQLCYPSLLKGDMGVCVYYFVMGRKRQDATFTQKGEDALGKIMSRMDRYKKLCIEDGIVGIALGMTFLLRHKYVEGDINEVLHDIDSYVYKGMEAVLGKAPHTEENLPILDMLIYFLMRYEDMASPIRKKFYRRIVVYLFNYIYVHRPDSFYQESLPFNLKKESYLFMAMLVRIYEAGMERKRISRIFKEMKSSLFSNFPMLHANRLYLMTVAYMVGDCIGDKEWLDFSFQLSSHIDFIHVLEEELADKNILPMSGVIGIWLLLEINQKMGNSVKSNLEGYHFRERIMKSTLWDRIEIDGEFLSNCYSLDGYCGIRLFLEYIG